MSIANASFFTFEQRSARTHRQPRARALAAKSVSSRLQIDPPSLRAFQFSFPVPKTSASAMESSPRGKTQPLPPRPTSLHIVDPLAHSEKTEGLLSPVDLAIMSISPLEKKAQPPSGVGNHRDHNDQAGYEYRDCDEYNHDFDETSFPLTHSRPTPKFLDIFTSVVNGVRPYHLPHRILSEISSELYGTPNVAAHLQKLDADLFFGTFSEVAYISPSAFAGYLKSLIEYMENWVDEKPLSSFVDILGKSKKWVSDANHVTRACRIFWLALHSDRNTLNVTADFRLELWYLFPDNSHQASDASLTERAFKSTLADIQSVGLRIQATTEVTDHLQLEGNIVKILKMTPALCEALWMYDQNRVARALRLDTLGAEIFSSLNVLYGKDEGYAEAAALKLIEPPTPQFLQRLRLAFLIGSTPVVLAGRSHALEDLIRHRRKWRPSLVLRCAVIQRDTPLVFWLTVACIIIGICQIIQTTVVVWGSCWLLKIES